MQLKTLEEYPLRSDNIIKLTDGAAADGGSGLGRRVNSMLQVKD